VQQFQDLNHGLVIDHYFLISHYVYLYYFLSLKDGCNMYLSLVSSEQCVAGFATLDVYLQDLQKTMGTKRDIKTTNALLNLIFFSRQWLYGCIFF